ncbi:hypothetical protein ACYULU_13810, partial [Breznakiellaceae bacterium SP9]
RTHSAFSSTRFPIPSNSLNAVPNIPSLIPQVYIIFPKIKTAASLIMGLALLHRFDYTPS